MIYQLVNAEQGSTLMKTVWPKIKAALEAGKQLQMEIKAVTRNNPQNEKMHAIIGEIAQQAQHMGAKWGAEDFKRLLIDQFAREIGIGAGKVIPNLDGTGIVQLGTQTRKFTKEQAAEFIIWLEAWAANNGVTLSE